MDKIKIQFSLCKAAAHQQVPEADQYLLVSTKFANKTHHTDKTLLFSPMTLIMDKIHISSCKAATDQQIPGDQEGEI